MPRARALLAQGSIGARVALKRLPKWGASAFAFIANLMAQKLPFISCELRTDVDPLARHERAAVAAVLRPALFRGAQHGRRRAAALTVFCSNNANYRQSSRPGTEIIDGLAPQIGGADHHKADSCPSGDRDRMAGMTKRTTKPPPAG